MNRHEPTITDQIAAFLENLLKKEEEAKTETTFKTGYESEFKDEDEVNQ